VGLANTSELTLPCLEDILSHSVFSSVRGLGGGGGAVICSDFMLSHSDIIYDSLLCCD